MQGKNGATTFLPLCSKLGVEVDERINSRGENREKECLTVKQANYIYRKVESGNLIDKSTMRQEIDQDIELDKMDDTNANENPYKELIVSNAGKIETSFSQMEQWSIINNVANYVQYDKPSQYVC